MVRDRSSGDNVAPLAGSGRGRVRLAGKPLVGRGIAFRAAGGPGLGFESVQAEGLRIITENSPPRNYVEQRTGRLTGHAVEIVREIQRRLGDASPIEVLPWARGYALLGTAPNILLFSTTRTPEREDLCQWVGPIAVNEWVFLARRDSSLVIEGLDDARRVGSIGAYPGDARELFLRRQGFTNIDVVAGPESILRKVLAGRNDLWLVDLQEYAATARRLGVDPGELKPLYTVRKVELYLAFSRDVPARTVEAWATALDDMKADGSYRAILERWGL